MSGVTRAFVLLFFFPVYTYKNLNRRAGMHFFAPFSSSTHLAQSVHHTATSWEQTPVDCHFLSGTFLSGGLWIFTRQQDEQLREQSQDAEIQAGNRDIYHDNYCSMNFIPRHHPSKSWRDRETLGLSQQETITSSHWLLHWCKWLVNVSLLRRVGETKKKENAWLLPNNIRQNNKGERMQPQALYTIDNSGHKPEPLP